jgi:hypothetical protein
MWRAQKSVTCALWKVPDENDILQHDCEHCTSDIEDNCKGKLQNAPDVGPSDYHLFVILKYHMRGQHYENENAVQEAVRSWLWSADQISTAVEVLSLGSTGRNVKIILQIL